MGVRLEHNVIIMSYVLLGTLLSHQDIPLLVSGSRQKRIIFGTPLLERNISYTVVQYHVWVSKIFGGGGGGRSHVGGGALITPRIVQTACHILSTTVRIEGKPLTVAKVIDHWSNRMAVFIGYNAISEMKNPMWSARFHIHENCGRVIQGFYEFEHWVSQDFGWIWLDKNVDEAVAEGLLPSVNIQYAPQYAFKDLGLFYNYVTNSRGVCLIIGYGMSVIENGVIDADSLSPVLLHGWQAVLDYMTCYIYSRAWYELLWEFIPINYLDVATWFCSAGMPGLGNRTQMPGGSDSGSPITCNNAYVGIISGGSALDPKLYGDAFRPSLPVITVSAAIAFAAFENSYELRPAFEAFMDCGCYDNFNVYPRNLTFRPRGDQLPTARVQPFSGTPKATNPYVWFALLIIYL